MEKKPVVITTENRGVFFGYLIDDSNAPSVLVIERARMCVYWSASVKGVVGLAATGPSSDSRVTHSIPNLTLYQITAIMECTPEAQENWELGPWGN